MNKPIFEQLVKVFYSNTSAWYKRVSKNEVTLHDDSFLSDVMGRTIKITPQLLEQVLGLKSAPDAITCISDDVIVQELKQEMYVHNVKIHNFCTCLSLMDQLLHLIVSHILLPIGSKHSIVSDEDLRFMHHIKR